MKKQIYLMVVAVCLGLLTKAQTGIPTYVPTNGSVGWWPFNGNANDLSGNANNGTVNGATLTADRYGNSNKAYSFDGINDGIEVGNLVLANTLNSYSIDFWCILNTLTLTPNGYTIFDDCDSLQWYGKGRFFTNSSYNPFNKATYGFRQYSNNLIKDSLGINQWVNYTCIFNFQLSKLYLYRNSILVDSSTYANNSYVIGNRKMQFGRCQSPLVYNGTNHYTGHWNGKIDDIGIWNRALTPCEVKKLYTSGSFSVSSSASNTICVGQSLNLTAAGATTYNWNTGATSQSISVSPTVSTVYTVSTTYSAGCADSRTFSVTVNACTGLNEAELVINSVRIFPNPAKEQLSIMVNNNAVMGKKYSITNTLGQEVASGIFTKQTTELNIQQLSAGLYQLNIEGLNENYKFIKE